MVQFRAHFRIAMSSGPTVLQCVAVCYSVLQSCCKCMHTPAWHHHRSPLRCSVLQRVAVCCSALQSCCHSAHTPALSQEPPVLQCIASCCSVLQCVAACCSYIATPRTFPHCIIVGAHCVAVDCSMLRCIAVCFDVLPSYYRILRCFHQSNDCIRNSVYRYCISDLITGLICKRALWKRLYSAKETCHFIDPADRSPHIVREKSHRMGWRRYGVATMSRLLKIIGLFCKRAL